MKLSGAAVLHGPVDQVYAALHDPTVLVRTIPGCERLEQVDADTYRARVTAGVASINGSFSGEVRLTDQQPPESFVLRASGAGTPGTITADVTVTLSDDGSGATLLAYDAEAVVGGMVGGVGQRILAGVAKKTAGEFFAAVDAVLTGSGTGAGAQPPPPAAERVPAVPAAEQVPVTPAVFTRPAATGAPAGGDFTRGLVLGAGIALLGAVVGGVLAGRVMRRR
jgi:carbon monoxide dehydrogenase subunit G